MNDLARDVVQRGYAALNLEYRRIGSPTWKVHWAESRRHAASPWLSFVPKSQDANSTLSDVSAGLGLLQSGKLPGIWMQSTAASRR